MKKLTKKSIFWLVTLLAISVVLSCKTVPYPVWDVFNKNKSEQLNNRIIDVKNKQKNAAIQFNDTMINLKAMYNLKGGNLEEAYFIVQNDISRSETSMDEVKKAIRQVEVIASEYLGEWETDINTITDESIRKKSHENFNETRTDYDYLHKTMKQTENSLERVFLQFRDHKTYLKHNLNFQSLKKMNKEIQQTEREMNVLIEELNNSIKQADIFLRKHP